MEHPLKDAYWTHGSVCEDYGAVEVPVRTLDGWDQRGPEPHARA